MRNPNQTGRQHRNDSEAPAALEDPGAFSGPGVFSDPVAREPEDLSNLNAQLDLAEQDAAALVANLPQALAVWRPDGGAWSVAQCLDHLARTNRSYLQAMENAASQARTQGRFRRRPAVPGWLGRWLVGTVEPPVKPRFQFKAPAIIQPDAAASLPAASEAFQMSQNQVRAFLAANGDLDLPSIKFPNPFMNGIRFTIATGLHVLTAHERRHLWQAWRTRRAAEAASPMPEVQPHPSSA